MHFTHVGQQAGAKVGRITLVAALHILVALGVISTMNAKTISLSAVLDDTLVWVKPEIPPPAPPPQPPTPPVRSAPPDIVVPQVEVDVPLPPEAPPLQATTEAAPEAALPAQLDAPPAPAAQPSTNTGQMRNAVLANADGCAKPDYPMRAARNGETGTVTLALLVGADGKVQQSRIQSSSGSRELDRAAVGALSMCQFQPANNNGVPEAGWAQIAYVWTLE